MTRYREAAVRKISDRIDILNIQCAVARKQREEVQRKLDAHLNEFEDEIWTIEEEKRLLNRALGRW